MHAPGDIKSATRFAQRFGPIESAQLVDIGGRSALEVLLAPGPGKTRTLRAWTRKIHIADAVIGKFNQRDPKTRLTVRGVLPTGIPVLLVATFDDRTETAAVTLLRERIEQRDTAALLNQLAAITA